MDSLSEARLQLVNPELAGKIRRMADMLALEGIVIKVTQGLRSWTEQMNLWLKGRDKYGSVVDKSKIVTNAAPGHSYHNFGLAVDVAPFNGTDPDWNRDHPAWKRIVAVGTSLGLTAGAEFRSFPDWPHFQLTGSLPASPTEDVREAFKDGGMFAVWQQAGFPITGEKNA